MENITRTELYVYGLGWGGNLVLRGTKEVEGSTPAAANAKDLVTHCRSIGLAEPFSNEAQVFGVRSGQIPLALVYGRNSYKRSLLLP